MPYDIIVGRNESDKKALGGKGLTFIGKGYVKMGQYTSLSNRILMDIARSHVVLVAGKRGSGKCLHGDTLITLADGSQVPIKYLENNKKKILSLNNKLKIETSEKSEFFSREIDKLIKLKLRSGKEIKLTPEHPLLTIKGWKPAKELTIRSRIATSRNLPSFGDKEMAEHEIKLLAYLLSEGHTKSVILFANSDEKIVEDFKGSLYKFDSSLKLVKEKESHYRISSPNWKTKVLEHNKNRNEKGQFIKNSNNIYKKRSIRELIERGKMFGLLSIQKYISQNIMQLKKENLALFLNRLFSCDGSIYKKQEYKGGGGYWEISYSSSSKKLIKQVQHLLLRFNILSKIRSKKIKLNDRIFSSYELHINSSNSLRFIYKIGFFGKKKERQEIAKKEISLTKKNTNIDTIPKEIWETYAPKNWAEIGRDAGYKHPKAMRERIKYAPSRQTLLQIAKSEQQGGLQLLAESDIFWDEIVSIEVLDGKFKVYDICVPENHNFIANDIIVHNSYTLGVLAEELSNLEKGVSQNIASIIFDTMGIYWTMKYKNEKDRELLQDWKLKTKSLPVKIFVPEGHYEKYSEKGIPADSTFALDPMEMNAEDWILTFGLNIVEPVAVLIERTVTKLKSSSKSYGIREIVKEIMESEKSQQEVKNAAIGLFEAAQTWGVFSETSKSATKIKDIINPGKTTVIDLSVYNAVGAFNVRALVISLLSRKLFNERMSARKSEEIESVSKGFERLTSQSSIKKESPLVWIFVDECLSGNTEIITDKAHTPIKDIVERFEKGEKFNVLGFDQEKKQYSYYPVSNVYKKGKRNVLKITTETGRGIICTPEHRVLTENHLFASAYSVNNLGFPLVQHYSTSKKLIESRILGHLFGDGWITDKQQSIGFSGKGNRKDLEKIREDLKKLGFKATNIYERRTKSKINHKGRINIVKGTSQSFTSNRPGYRYFRKKAEFSGIKTLHPTKIPDWLMNSPDLEKAEFLAALMGSDGQIISSAKNSKGDFNAIRLTFNKIEILKKEAFELANQIKRLFEDLGIKVSSISKKEGNLRKDGNKTIKIVITLKKNIENTIKFLEKIGYRYCSKKELEGLRWLEYLKARLFLKNERWKIKEKALELRSKGLGKMKISRELKFPEAQIRDWIYNNMSPGLPKSFPDFGKWIENREKGKILFEKVFRMEECGEKEVYDISVEKVHNFVSNSLVTHNCHEFLPRKGKTLATDALVQLLREGRQPGISLVLATQQPGQIHKDVMTQSDIVISHRVTSQQDLEALNQIMQSYVLESIRKQMDELPDLKGSAILLDDNSERIYPIRIRPRFTWHGGEAPTAVAPEKEL